MEDKERMEFMTRQLIQQLIPIKSERIVIRQYRLIDTFRFWDYVSDQELYEYLVCSRISSYDDAQSFVMNTMRHYKESALTRFVIADKETNEMLGVISSYIKNYDIKSGDYEIELGYWIGKPNRGKGYMREALSMFISNTKSLSGVNSIILDILKENKASRALACQLGFSITEEFKAIDYKNNSREAYRYTLRL